MFASEKAFSTDGFVEPRVLLGGFVVSTTDGRGSEATSVFTVAWKSDSGILAVLEIKDTLFLSRSR